MATPCRLSPPGSIQMLTRSTTQRQMLLRPDKEVTQAFFYILAYLQHKYEMLYHCATVLSDHSHVGLTDVLGDQIQKFNTEFFSLTARFVNQHHGRFENMWSSGKPNCVLIAPRAEDLIDKIAYMCNNVIDAGLVSHAKKWPGMSILPSQINGTTFVVRRPEKFFQSSKNKPVDSKKPAISMGSTTELPGNYDFSRGWPDELTITFTLPTVVDASPEELFSRIKQECNRRAEKTRKRFKATGRSFLGAKRVLRQSINSRAKSKRKYFGLIPTVACKDEELRKKFLNWLVEWRSRYKKIRIQLFERKEKLVFPEHSFAMHFYFGQQRLPSPG